MTENPDAISAAYQLGRLDVITVLLAIFAMIIAAGAFFSYRIIKNGAKKKARQAAKKELQKRLTDDKVAKAAEDAARKHFEKYIANPDNLEQLAAMIETAQERENRAEEKAKEVVMGKPGESSDYDTDLSKES
ncbi:MAG: hypothetical protein CMI12_14600 [Oceanospirillum sp.]|nr:hypothetical protein [Oceanospirillum sp.]